MKLDTDKNFPQSLRETSIRPRILLLAYSISPVRGSEYSVGWNYVKCMSKACDIMVLYGLAGPHMGDLEEIEDYLSENGEIAHVRFVPIRPNALARLLNKPNRSGFLVYSFYLAYRIWHRQAARKACEIVEQEEVDLIHYLCPIGYREPGFLWKLPKPYVWGPIGGLVQTLQLPGAPRPRTSRLKTWLKNLLNWITLTTSRRVPRALRAADVVVAATSEGQTVLRDRFGIATNVIQENAIPDEWIDTAKFSRCTMHKAPVILIWIGTLDWRKSPDLLLDAMAKVGRGNWHLHIVGAGALSGMARKMATENGLDDQITFHNQVPRDVVGRLLAESDLHIITSMGEGNPTTIWEAMAAGVPTLTLDHCGMHDVVCDACGVRVTPTDYVGTRDRIAVEISALIQDRSKLSALADGVIACRDQYLWSKRSQQWLDIYRGVIERAQAR
jgi:glycosyltransferase involved in cell wall biosynthesis